ncbi:putative Down syndrome critical region protein 3 [Penaeus vannamei]|uniref:Vacuolar protein sorting-associated protein 26C n=1 Tax=Penaeus vannamei TaxID=6689 RepID=A0A423S9L3_PENVA|nr:putative Down syndrome critical region protein 3 [Penaeus vannamei]
MSLTVEIRLKRPSRIYHEGDNVSGLLVLDSKSEVRHDGITLTMEGVISLQLSPKSAGLIESIVNSSKPISIINNVVEVAKSGKIPSGQTEIPFELPLKVRGSKTLYETYHGVYITIQYFLRCDIKRSLLAKDVTKAQEFIVEYKQGVGDVAQPGLINFEMRPETLPNVRDRARIPKFLVRGHLDSEVFSLSKPLTGEPISIINNVVEVAKSGKIPSGQTEIPFELPLKVRGSKTLYETYHGVYITIQYFLRCDIKRSLLAKDVTKAQEFIVEYKQGVGDVAQPGLINFEMRPETLPNVRDRARIPKFLVRGHLDSEVFSLSKPLTGELTVCECERGISSIELQLVRVETCGSAEGNTREATEIQNIQIGEGDVCRGIAIPIYMVFPRLFTCATTIAPNFKIEFELNIVIIFDNDHLVVETFPIKLTRH